jgi:hypothetical protein
MMFVEIFSEGLSRRGADTLAEIDGKGRINPIIGIERRTVDYGLMRVIISKLG